MLDLNAYAFALERFIAKLNQHKGLSSEFIQQESDVLFSMLDVSKIEVTFRDRNLKELSDISEKIHYYESGKPCGDTPLTWEHQSESGMRIVFQIYPAAGIPAWTEEERTRLFTIMGLVHSYFSRNNLMRIVRQLTYKDRDLEMYNHIYFMKVMGDLAGRQAMRGLVAIRFNLKRFSAVNDQLGREKGNLVMRRFAKKLESMLESGSDEIICRLGGDNFTMLVRKPTLARVLPALEEGLRITYDEKTGECVNVSAYIGVYEITEPVVPPPIVMDKISMAAYEAKESKSTNIVIFDESMMQLKSKNQRIMSMFPKAMENEELQVYYQPKVTVDGYTIVGAEALCRWIQDDKIIPPGDFIPILEQGMDICALDFYMLDHVCRDIRRWLDTGKRVVRISVNLSRRHMADSNLLQHILDIVDRHKVPHEFIEIELTETTTDVEFRDLKRVVSGLQGEGFITSVDDFGVGYSSLTLIKDIPWDVLKVDKSLLPEEGEELDLQKKIMYKYVLKMAQEMGIESITEGVETAEQLTLLRDSGCSLAQGFLFDRPLCVSDFEERLAQPVYHIGTTI